MFFLFPVGHDQEVYTRPWLTFAIIAACTVVFLWSRSAEQDARSAVELEMMDVHDALDRGCGSPRTWWRPCRWHFTAS